MRETEEAVGDEVEVKVLASLQAESPQEQVEAIVKLLVSPAERERLAQAGRERVLGHHAWAQSMKRLDAIVERCITGFKQGAQ